ncbi:MAG: hypothetical protein U5K30_01975 [Acidimicrobiales bacterium]|nr:hypothetical protein [Acidimicrobiales bacterium]
MRRKMISVLGVAMLLLAACGDDDDGGGDGNDNGAAADGIVDLVGPAVSEPMLEELVAAFGEEEPDVEVALRTVDGEPDMNDALSNGTDVAITPPNWIGDDVDAEPQPLGRNPVVYAVPEGNPDDLTVDAFAPDSTSTTRVCGVETPFGDFVLTALERFGVTPDPETVETGCEDEALEQVASGDIDAAADVPGRPRRARRRRARRTRRRAEHRDRLRQRRARPARTTSRRSPSFLGTDRAQAVLEDNGYLP